ncbi:hemerythrin-like metal-binding protein [Thiorhodococcus drewsii AZ1]|uniref:Hemerythrin-like metal-binding protein n=1 Tax=Thiorhodococcus drewsii AZ1 TaxID=765913 RepID=G2E6H1_9GAMM|nr:hemerythrin family protein [Thiorhodococcus drewsii]EGV28332.1 hemerythrin-like metal-binding protein [Thiorhodococcus drewsii AZ1]
MALIEDFEARFLLGVPAMDRNHREFVDLLNRMDGASSASFADLFAEMVLQTHAHFAAEEAMMRETAFGPIAEHRAEHQRVLGDLERFARQVRRGRVAMARAYVIEQMPGWFAQHALTMDSALAAHLRRKQVAAVVDR